MMPHREVIRMVRRQLAVDGPPTLAPCGITMGEIPIPPLKAVLVQVLLARACGSAAYSGTVRGS